jgi:hypothetical protein
MKFCTKKLLIKTDIKLVQDWYYYLSSKQAGIGTSWYCFRLYYPGSVPPTNVDTRHGPIYIYRTDIIIYHIDTISSYGSWGNKHLETPASN